MIKCPNPECGYENVDGTQFCEMCGEELKGASAIAAPTAGAVPATGAAEIKCPACENMNPAENVVCEVCGSELRPGALDASMPPAVATTAAPASTPPTSAPAPTPAASATPFDAPLSSSAPAMPAMPATPVGAATDTAVSTGTDATLPDVSVSTVASPDMASPPPATLPTMPAAVATDAPTADAPAMTFAPSNDAPLTDAPMANPSVIDTSAPVAPVPPVAPTAPTTSGNLQPGGVKLTVEQGMSVGKHFVLGDAEIQVGREDDEDGIYPDIDLSDQDEGYVHRKHATLRFDNGTLTVEHLGGANKTRINNRPLPDNTPQPVNIGDKVAFGKVVLRVGTNP